MAIYTLDDLVTRILTRLGEIGFGQTAEPEARQRVIGPLDGILDELAADGVIDFAVSETIPGAAMDPLSAVVASKLTDDFGLTTEQITLLATRAQAAQDKLRRFRWQGYSSFSARRGTFF